MPKGRESEERREERRKDLQTEQPKDTTKKDHQKRGGTHGQGKRRAGVEKKY